MSTWRHSWQGSRQLTPDVDPETVSRAFSFSITDCRFRQSIATGLRITTRVRAVFEPAGPHVGLLAAYFRPHVKQPAHAQIRNRRTIGARAVRLSEPQPEPAAPTTAACVTKYSLQRLAAEMEPLLK